MEFKNTKVWGFEHALRGMRNPKNSWKNSDSHYADVLGVPTLDYVIGPQDMKLAQQLINAGPEHRKFMRQIFVSVDITAPLYWWKEFDTYKVGTVANSTSTMHKLTSGPITIDCFEIDDFNAIDYPVEAQRQDLKYNIDDSFVQMCLIPYLEYLRQKYIETEDYIYWKELIRWLPESWLQTRTITLSYENLLAMCSRGQRRFHKLNEWSGKRDDSLANFISWARTLPYAQELIFIDETIDKRDEFMKHLRKAYEILDDGNFDIKQLINDVYKDGALGEINHRLLMASIADTLANAQPPM